MLSDDSGGLCSQSLCGQDELLLLDGKDLTTDKTSHGYPIKKCKYKEDTDHTCSKLCKEGAGNKGLQSLLEYNREQDNHQHIRQRIDDINYSHHNKVNLAAKVAGDRTVECTYNKNDNRSEKTNGERDSCSVNNADKVISAQAVGSQKMGEHVLTLFNHLIFCVAVFHRT